MKAKYVYFEHFKQLLVPQICSIYIDNEAIIYILFEPFNHDQSVIYPQGGRGGGYFINFLVTRFSRQQKFDPIGPKVL